MTGGGYYTLPPDKKVPQTPPPPGARVSSTITKTSLQNQPHMDIYARYPNWDVEVDDENLQRALERLKKNFPLSFINESNELILLPAKNVYLNLNRIKTFEDLCCRVICSLSREIANSNYYSREGKNIWYRQDMQERIENSIGYSLTTDDWEYIYTFLGNDLRPDLTREFVELDFDMDYLVAAIKKENKKEEYF